MEVTHVLSRQLVPIAGLLCLKFMLLRNITLLQR